MSLSFPVRWEQYTSDHDKAAKDWEAERRQREGFDRYHGCGCWLAESITEVALRCSFDGSVVLRMHVQDWSKFILSFRVQPRMVDLPSGRKAVDFSDVLPQARRRFYVVADNSIPRGHGLLTSERGDELAMVYF